MTVLRPPLRRQTGKGSLRSNRVRALLVFAVLALSACSSLPTDVQRTPSYALSDTSSTRLARDIQPLLTEHPALSGFHVLSDGADAFATRLRMISLAEMSIDAQYYIWHTDLTGNAMYNQLLVAADRGVRVRILLDDLDTAGKDEMLLFRLTSCPVRNSLNT